MLNRLEETQKLIAFYQQSLYSRTSRPQISQNLNPIMTLAAFLQNDRHLMSKIVS